MEKLVNKNLAIAVAICMDVVLFGLFIQTPLYVAIPLLFVLQVTFMGYFFYMFGMPEKVSVIHILHILENSVHLTAHTIKTLFRKLDVIVPGLFVWGVSKYVMPWVATQDLPLPIEKSVVVNASFIAEELSDLVLILLITYAVITVANAVHVFLTINIHRVRYVLAELSSIGIEARFVHRNGKMCVDWDDMLDKLAHSDHPGAKFYYIYIIKHFEHLKDLDFNPFRQKPSLSDMLYEAYKNTHKGE